MALLLPTMSLKRFHPITEPKEEICVFCNCSTSITKEHVLPKWFVDEELHNTMTSIVNKQLLTYNKAVIPACSECNNSILGFIENYIIKVIHTINHLSDCDPEDSYNIIRWLEIIDYKFQVLDCRRRYIKYANSEYDRDWGQFPVSMMRHLWTTLNPWKAYDWLRSSQRRITIKKKDDRMNSFVVIRPRVPHFYFFSQPNEYVYLSFPAHRIAFFYFLKRTFEFYDDAAAEALKIINEVIESD